MKKRTVEIIAAASEVTWEDIKATDGDGESQRRFLINAYTGVPLSVDGWPAPVVVEIAGIRQAAKSTPVLKDHDATRIVGHSDHFDNSGSSLVLGGVVSGTGAAAKEVVATSKNGFPWQASMNAVPTSRPKFVKRGESIEANGRKHEGPIYYVATSTLRETSFLSMGADPSTSASIAAKAKIGVDDMTFQEWVADKGFSDLELSDSQTAVLKAAFDAENAVVAKPAEPPKPEKKEVVDGDGADDPVNDYIKAQADARKRVAEIDKLCEGFPAVAAKALEECWDIGRTEAEVKLVKIKSERPAGIDSFNIQTDDGITSEMDVIEAALSLSVGTSPEQIMDPYADTTPGQRLQLGTDVRPIGEKTIEAAMKHYPSIGLHEFMQWACRYENKSISRTWGTGATTIKAAFTTHSLPTVFENVVNRQLLAAYRTQTQRWREIARTASVRDFRQTKSFRVYGTGFWKTLTDGGELRHGILEEGPKFVNEADTIGQINMLTRKDLINDDVGALNGIATMMANYGVLAPEIKTWETLLDNKTNDGGADFFSTANANIATGAGSAWDGTTALKALWLLFQKHNAGPSNNEVPIEIEPVILVVPREIQIDVEEFLATRTLAVTSGGSKSKDATDNFFFRKFSVVSPSYISKTGFHANINTKSWYLFADPNVAPAIEVVFLNGRQRPTIESVEPKPDMLGVGFRGYFDFGMRMMDPNAAAKSVGT